MFVTTPDDLTLLTAWGKWNETSGQIHPWACHSLDVMAAGAAYLDANPGLISRAETILNEEEPPYPQDRVRKLLLWFIALHDIGKVSPWFQAKKYTNLPTGLPLPNTYHSNIGGALLDRLTPFLEREFNYQPFNHQNWFRSIFGHHGFVSEPETENPLNQFDLQPDVYVGLVERFILHLTRILNEVEPGDPIGKNLFPSGTSEYPKLEPILAGLTILSDWVGSNSMRVEFGFHASKIGTQTDLSYEDLKTYYETHTHKIRQSVRDFGLQSLQPNPNLKGTFRELFGKEPRTLQTVVETIPLGEGRVYLIEDQTGSGKTEAALLLACRIIQNGMADRVHFLLPTGATTNAMHERVRNFLKKNFTSSETLPSLSIAHSTSQTGNEDFDYGGGEWIRDNRKKVYLANFAISTVDQALFSILPQRHNILRFFGLLQGVVVFDEIHSYDPYTLGLIADLIRQLYRMGGRVVMLSATLSRDVKEYLYRQIFSSSSSMRCSPHYPLVSVLRKDLDPIEFPALPHEEREVRVESIKSNQDAVRLFDTSGARLWIRNTVREAIETYLELAQQFPGSNPILYHGRFTAWDRKRIESEVLRLFGWVEGDILPSTQRIKERNRILVATQVVEQSLDLDFDLIVSDLCPIDMLLQRVGRLHRHNRPGRTNPIFYVRTPQWRDGRIEDLEMSGTPKVYRDVGLLALTEDQIGRSWKIPSMVRELLDSVYRDDPKTASYRARRSRKSHAISRAVKDHCQGWQTSKAEPVSTREGSSMVEVVLCEGSTPLHGTEEASRIRIREDDLPIQKAKGREDWIEMTRTDHQTWSCAPYQYSSMLGFFKTS